MNESDLKRALTSHAADVVTSPPSWDDIERDAGAIIAARQRRNRMAGAAAAVAVVLVAVLIGSGVSRNDGRQLRSTDRPGSVAGPAADPTTAPPAQPAYDPNTEGIWPLASQTDLELYKQSGSTEYDTPEGTAKAFLATYGGLQGAAVGPFTPGDDVEGRRTGRLGASPEGQVGFPMTVSVAQVGPDGPWTVTGVTCESIVVHQPTALASISSPVAVRGLASAFEGTVNVEVHQDGQVFGQRLGAGVVMGRGDGVLGAFEGSIPFASANQPGGAVVFMELSPKDGAPSRIAVVRVHLAA